MVRVFTFLIAISIGLLAFRSGGEECTSQSLEKSGITCSSCHGSSINIDIIIEPGKLEEDENGVVSAGIDIIFDNPGYAVAEMIISSEAEIGKISRNKEDRFYEIANGGVVLTSTLNSTSKEKSAATKKETITLEYTMDGYSNKPIELQIQGVIANNDGTPEGDIVFEKENFIRTQFHRSIICTSHHYIQKSKRIVLGV